MKNKLLKDYNFFQNELDNLMINHKSEYALVKNQKIIQIFKNQEDALKHAKKENMKLGTFLVQEITDKIEIISRFAL